MECRPSLARGLPPLRPPARLRAAGQGSRARTQAQGRRPPRTLAGQSAGRRAEGTSAPKEMANRKCPYCNAETVQVPALPHLPRPASQARGRPPEEPRERARVATPHPGPAPQVHAGRARLRPGAASPGPAIPPGSDRDSKPRASRSEGSPSGDVARAPRALRATPRWQVSAELAWQSAAARRALRTVLTSGETPNSPRGRARLGSTPPAAHAPPEPRAGSTPARGANSSRDENVPARHGTAASAPHAQSRPHALPPRRAARGLTVSSAAAKGRLGPGPDTIWQSTAAAPVAPSRRLRDTQPRAGSGSCGGDRRSTTSPACPPARSLARFLPSSPPRCHGNTAPRRSAPPLLPSRLPQPTPASLPPPYRGGGRPSGLS